MISSHDKITLFYDRISVAHLEAHDRKLLSYLQEWNIGKVNQKETIHFCGMLRQPDGRTAVFLPRSMTTGSIDNARLTMATLSRYGVEATCRDFIKDGDQGNSGILAIIWHLAEDYRRNGLFHERQRIRSRNTGKPDWKRTVTRERAFSCENSGDFFFDLATTKAIDSSETLLAQVQAIVITEICAHHGWWIQGLKPRLADLRWQKKPYHPRSLWPTLLDSLLPSLYSARSIFLAKNLAYYLRNCRASVSGSLIFGVEDFHIIWETMLRKTLNGVEQGWNKRLPKPIYEQTNGKALEAPQRGMQTDIILKSGTDYTIIDAKYYEASSAQTAPGWADIAKQMFYELALREVVGTTPTIRNAFVFPKTGNTNVKLKSVSVWKEANIRAASFPYIECLYLDTESIMRAYVEHRRNIDLPALI